MCQRTDTDDRRNHVVLFFACSAAAFNVVAFITVLETGTNTKQP